MSQKTCIVSSTQLFPFCLRRQVNFFCDCLRSAAFIQLYVQPIFQGTFHATKSREDTQRRKAVRVRIVRKELQAEGLLSGAQVNGKRFPFPSRKSFPSLQAYPHGSDALFVRHLRKALSIQGRVARYFKSVPYFRLVCTAQRKRLS
jgi:hypothetical protein